MWNNRLLVNVAEWAKETFCHVSPLTWTILHFTHKFIIKSSSIKHKKKRSGIISAHLKQ